MRKLQRRCLIHDRFGCGYFSSTPTLSMPLTSCAQEISLSSFSDSWDAGGGTALYDALHWGIQNLVSWRKQNPSACPEKAEIVVLTDGEDGDSRHSIQDVQQLMQSARPGIQVVLVGIGATGSELRRLSQGPNGSLAELVQEEEDSGEAIDRSLRRVRDADRDRVEAFEQESVAKMYPRAQARSRSRSRSRSPPRRTTSPSTSLLPSSPSRCNAGFDGGSVRSPRRRSPRPSRRRSLSRSRSPNRPVRYSRSPRGNHPRRSRSRS